MMRSQAGVFYGGLFTGPTVENGSLTTRRRRPESVNNPVVMRPPVLIVRKRGPKRHSIVVATADS